MGERASVRWPESEDSRSADNRSEGPAVRRQQRRHAFRQFVLDLGVSDGLAESRQQYACLLARFETAKPLGVRRLRLYDRQLNRLRRREGCGSCCASGRYGCRVRIGRPEDAGPPRGANDLDRDAIVTFMAYNFTRFFGDVENDFRTVVAEGEVVVVEHRLSATLPNGRSYVNDYCFLFEVRDGKVWRIREYMDTRGGWKQVFGEGEPLQLVEYVAG